MGKVLLLSLLIFSSSLYAEQNTKQQKIDELISVMNLDSMVDSMYGQVEGMMKGMSDQMGVKPSEQAIFDKYYGDMTTVLKTEMSWAKMQPMMVNVYDKHFSEQEIADMLAFYKTYRAKNTRKNACCNARVYANVTKLNERCYA